MKKILAVSMFSAMVVFCQAGLMADSVSKDNGMADDVTKDNGMADGVTRDSSMTKDSIMTRDSNMTDENSRDSGMKEGVAKESAMADGSSRDSSMPDGVEGHRQGILSNAKCPIEAKGQIDRALQAATGQLPTADSCVGKGQAAAYASCVANPDSLQDAIQAGIKAFKECKGQ